MQYCIKVRYAQLIQHNSTVTFAVVKTSNTLHTADFSILYALIVELAHNATSHKPST